MKDLIDSILIGGCASYLPFWIWNNAGEQLAGALALIVAVSVHSQTVACMEKLLIKGKKNETNKKESKWFVQDPDEHTENIKAGMAAGRAYGIWRSC